MRLVVIRNRLSSMQLGLLTIVILGLAGGFLWTALGLMIALLSRQIESYLLEWFRLQGPFLIGFGVLLVSIREAGRLQVHKEDLQLDSTTIVPNILRKVILVGVTTLGTASLVSLGFNGVGIVKLFYWATCFLVCSMASIATLHAVEILIFANELQRARPKLHIYSPADTPAVRRLAEYVSIYGVVITVGYAFAFSATLAGTWQADALLIRSVQLFWPIIYVPLCLAALAYPHMAVFRLVRAEKDRVISGLQQQIASISSRSLSNDDIDTLNALADLIQKIEDTPNYPSNLRILGSWAATFGINLATIIVPRDLATELLRQSITF